MMDGDIPEVWRTAREIIMAVEAQSDAASLRALIPRFPNELVGQLSCWVMPRACELGDEEILSILLDAGYDVNPDLEQHLEPRTHTNESPLHKAVEMGHEDCVAILLDAGANVDATNIEAETPLHYACWTGGAQIVARLLEAGASIHHDSGMEHDSGIIYDELVGSAVGHPIHVAAAKSRECVQLLLDAGATTDVRGVYFGQTPLHHAAAAGQLESLLLLLASGAEVDAPVQCHDGSQDPSSEPIFCNMTRTPLSFASQESCIVALLAAGANARKSTICPAALSGNRRLLYLLLRAGARISWRARDDNPPEPGEQLGGRVRKVDWSFFYFAGHKPIPSEVPESTRLYLEKVIKAGPRAGDFAPYEAKCRQAYGSIVVRHVSGHRLPRVLACEVAAFWGHPGAY